MDKLRRPPPFPSPLRPRERVYCRAWHCEVADRLFLLRFSSPKATAEEFDRALAAIARR